jgi:hypothetical protein
MASLFIQADKPFYLAGDTVNGLIFLNLFENMNASEVLVKFKGWESVRWFEERLITEQEVESIPPHLIYQTVGNYPYRCSPLGWIAQIRKTTPGRMSFPNSNMSETAFSSNK